MHTMTTRGTRGAYRKEDRVALPKELQRELVEKAAARIGNCQELAKKLNIPKSSVHYYQVGRITIPVSILEAMIELAADSGLNRRIRDAGIQKDRNWANEYAVSVYREMCREKLRLPTREELEKDDELRRKAAAIISYVMAEGSIWLQKEKWGECAANITFAAHETDLYEHFRSLCRDVFFYEIGPPQKPGNGAEAIRGFVYTRFIAEWMIEHGVMPGEKSARTLHLPDWVMRSKDERTWIAAAQPWCDGEGCVARTRNGRLVGFSISQSRHTDMDVAVLPHPLTWRGTARILPISRLSTMEVYGLPAKDYCLAMCRSEIMNDLSILFKRLGFRPRLGIHSMYLKDDGFWSCNWLLAFRRREAIRLVSEGIVSQERKVLRTIQCPH